MFNYSNEKKDKEVENKESDINVKWLTPKEVAFSLKVSYKTVIKLIKYRELTSYKFARHHKIHPQDLLSYISERKTTAIKGAK